MKSLIYFFPLQFYKLFLMRTDLALGKVKNRDDLYFIFVESAYEFAKIRKNESFTPYTLPLKDGLDFLFIPSEKRRYIELDFLDLEELPIFRTKKELDDLKNNKKGLPCFIKIINKLFQWQSKLLKYHRII